jgi:hypothetical protein
LGIRFAEPAYREPLVVDVQTPTAERITIEVNRPVRLRLNYAALRPHFEGDRTPTFSLWRGDGSLRPLSESDNQDLSWGNGHLEWTAEPGRYELRTR